MENLNNTVIVSCETNNLAFHVILTYFSNIKRSSQAPPQIIFKSNSSSMYVLNNYFSERNFNSVFKTTEQFLQDASGLKTFISTRATCLGRF